MKQITELQQIDYKSNPEGRLLFTALTILTTENYRDKTPDEVIGLLNEKSKFLDECQSTHLHWAIRLRKGLLIRGSWKWNSWIRSITAKMEQCYTFKSY